VTRQHLDEGVAQDVLPARLDVAPRAVSHRDMRAPAPTLFALLTAACLSTIAARAGADVAPPRPGPETCTVQKQARPGSECLACGAFFGNPEHCSASLASYGFTSACRTGGASAWSEVWCRASTPAAAKVPPEVLGQLDKPTTGLRPAATTAPSATAAPLPPPALPASPPTPTSAAAPAPVDTNAPGPQPVPPPPAGCACTASGGGESLPALMVALGAAAAAISRRRRR
jgi:MYXO-CTERM domain-containing protein